MGNSFIIETESITYLCVKRLLRGRLKAEIGCALRRRDETIGGSPDQHVVCVIDGHDPILPFATENLSDEIRQINDGPAAQALADRVNAQADALAAAVEANPDPTPNP